MTEQNALEILLADVDGSDEHYFPCYSHTGVRVGELRAIAKEYREMEESQLKQREGECCENCEHACGRSEFPNIVEIHCHKPNREYHWYPSHFKCCYYTAKPKARRCKWKVATISVTKAKMSEEEAESKYGQNLIGPVEGTWEEVE